MEFFINFGKFVTKIRAFGNNTIFLQQFFGFTVDFPPLPPGYARAPTFFLNVLSHFTRPKLSESQIGVTKKAGWLRYLQLAQLRE